MSRSLKWTSPLILTLAPLMMAPKCGDQVVIPASDPSAPTVAFYYRVDGGDVTAFPASRQLDVDEGHEICVYVLGTDNQGLQSLSYDGSAKWVCDNSDDGVHHTAILHGEEAQAGKPGDKASTGMYVGECLKTNELCTGEVLRSGGTMVFWPKAKNFSGTRSASSQATVNIITKPPVATPDPDPTEPPKTCKGDETCCEPDGKGGCKSCVVKGLTCQ